MNKMRFTKVREVKTPSRGNKGDAGLDFFMPSNLSIKDFERIESNRGIFIVAYSDENIIKIALNPLERVLIPSGIKVLLEPKYSMLMAANKSGLATKKGLLYTAEIVDSPYTGELHLGIINLSNEVQVIEAGSKVTQFIHVPVYLSEPQEIDEDLYDEISSTWGSRGDGGFGSTGE